MNACRTRTRSRCSLLLLALILGACSTSRAPSPAELNPLSPQRAPRAALPDDLERAASRISALALADLLDAAAEGLGLLRGAEQARTSAGAATSGLVDLAEEVVVATSGSSAYLAYAERALERGSLDPSARRRMQRALAEAPLNVAEQSLRDERAFRSGLVFNRIASPLSRLALTGAVNPIESGRAALRSLLTLHHFPTASTRERRALRAYETFLQRAPDSAEAAAARIQVERLGKKVRQHRFDAAIEAAETALERHRYDTALLYVARAERLWPGQQQTRTLQQRALGGRALRNERIYSTLRASPDQVARRSDHALAVALLGSRRGDLQARLAAIALPQPLPAGTEAFFSAVATTGPGTDDAFFAQLDRARNEPGPMARHAAGLVRSPVQNPYRWYRDAVARDRSGRLRWLFLGRLARGPAERDLPRPLEYLLDVPALVINLATTPVRALQYGRVTRMMGRGVLGAGERYVQRFPDGAHVARVHRDLERRYATAGLWSSALDHNQARAGASERQARRYRQLLADSLLASAERERRIDMRVAVYRAILSDYGETRAASTARRELTTLLQETSPQNIRLSREFLLAHPRIWRSDALAPESRSRAGSPPCTSCRKRTSRGWPHFSRRRATAAW
jgi:hypothetical protein